MLFRGIRGLNKVSFSSSPYLYNKRFADKFKDAYVVEPLVDDTNNSKDNKYKDGDYDNQGLQNLFDRKISPAFQKYFDYAV